MAGFVKVAELSALEPGSSMTVQAGEKEIALFNVGGAIFATDNTCLHRGGPLGEGTLDGETVTCPWHMWEYNVRTGEKCGAPEVRVSTYPVQVEGNDIKVEV